MLENVVLSACGIRHIHDRSFVIDRPHGSGDYLFLLYHQPVMLEASDGFVSRPANTCIVFAPGFKQLYHGDNTLENTYFHFDGECVASWLAHCGVPVNQPLSLGALADLMPLVREMMTETLRREDNFEELVSTLVLQFFLKLGRVAARHNSLSSYHAVLQERIRSVRATVHSSLETKWTVEQMASLANLSASRFAALYPQYFQSTPMDDLINSRLDHASYLLRQTSMTIDTIAETCGFSSPQHFSKMYRLRRGQSPGQCR
jgi:AraC family transcriptional regulator of arabinose operon